MSCSPTASGSCGTPRRSARGAPPLGGRSIRGSPLGAASRRRTLSGCEPFAPRCTTRGAHTRPRSTGWRGRPSRHRRATCKASTRGGAASCRASTRWWQPTARATPSSRRRGGVSTREATSTPTSAADSAHASRSRRLWPRTRPRSSAPVSRRRTRSESPRRPPRWRPSRRRARSTSRMSRCWVGCGCGRARRRQRCERSRRRRRPRRPPSTRPSGDWASCSAARQPVVMSRGSLRQRPLPRRRWAAAVVAVPLTRCGRSMRSVAGCWLGPAASRC
mmetsp:Transcript_49941/g.165367  ORF Transcript_49941/g.165367 Transcript_49941/m.165367 type:complete len:276 (+) Transcript_49941:242-1069(+)